VYTFYFEVINTLWGAKFKLYATDAPGTLDGMVTKAILGREFQQKEVETLVRNGFRVMLEPSKFVKREEPVLRLAPGYLEPKPITSESVNKFVHRVMVALDEYRGVI